MEGNAFQAFARFIPDSVGEAETEATEQVLEQACQGTE